MADADAAAAAAAAIVAEFEGIYFNHVEPFLLASKQVCRRGSPLACKIR